MYKKYYSKMYKMQQTNIKYCAVPPPKHCTSCWQSAITRKWPVLSARSHIKVVRLTKIPWALEEQQTVQWRSSVGFGSAVWASSGIYVWSYYGIIYHWKGVMHWVSGGLLFWDKHWYHLPHCKKKHHFSSTVKGAHSFPTEWRKHQFALLRCSVAWRKF